VERAKRGGVGDVGVGGESLAMEATPMSERKALPERRCRRLFFILVNGE